MKREPSETHAKSCRPWWIAAFLSMSTCCLSPSLRGQTGASASIEPGQAGENRRAPIENPPAAPAAPLRLVDAIRLSLANVETVQANIAVRTAAVARFDALKQFVPLINLPQLAVAFNKLAGSGKIMILPDVTDGALLVGNPMLQQAALNRVSMFFPLDPAGHITALPIAEEGVHAKIVMEQLVRRSQVMLAIQDYYAAKQLQYGIRTALLGVALARENLDLTRRKLRQRQSHDVEVGEAMVSEGKARVLLADLEKASRISQRELDLVMHQSRLLVPQQEGVVPIGMDHIYEFDLIDPDEADLSWMPDFPDTREEAIQLAKQQRMEVRLRVVGMRIARLQQQRSLLGLLGTGGLPTELGFKNAGVPNGGVTLGAIFGTSYGLPIQDVGLWSSVRAAHLDAVQSQLELERALIDVAADTGNSWDRWRQAIREWEQRERELQLRHELLERQERLYKQKQSIMIEVLGARVNLLQADANRWTAWYNLQLARFDILRATEQLLDYVERKRIARLTVYQKPIEDGNYFRRPPWLPSWRGESARPAQEGSNANP